jgi:hypothetical protein
MLDLGYSTQTKTADRIAKAVGQNLLERVGTRLRTIVT